MGADSPRALGAGHAAPGTAPLLLPPPAARTASPRETSSTILLLVTNQKPQTSRRRMLASPRRALQINRRVGRARSMTQELFH